MLLPEHGLILFLLDAPLIRVKGRVVLLADGLKAPREGKEDARSKIFTPELKASNSKASFIMGHSIQAI